MREIECEGVRPLAQCRYIDMRGAGSPSDERITKC